MNIYMTSGTPDFMETLRDKYPQENMIAMQAGDNSVLLHETTGKTVFQTPRHYEVIASSGALDDNGYFVFNHIPVTDEGRPIFEHRFKKLANALDEVLGFIAFRLLRPLHSDMYIVITEWSANTYYKMWKKSSSFNDAHLTGHIEAGVDSTPHIFTGASSVTAYIGKTRGDES
ncbi:antibiotic biosynthesis monooxygenase [Sporosarcina sp. YIM B06819]|uniref:antibiotic biosynthesis monooxygenase family protein n=1 Tax=Sporosarcina sp. YIM B06819 TaxID=3081769 RepID=UPI00298CC810|nr:antibiotic biosynthesis monooxygenase [Sporosarcina sp. YIM B06819]